MGKTTHHEKAHDVTFAGSKWSGMPKQPKRPQNSMFREINKIYAAATADNPLTNNFKAPKGPKPVSAAPISHSSAQGFSSNIKIIRKNGLSQRQRRGGK